MNKSMGRTVIVVIGFALVASIGFIHSPILKYVAAVAGALLAGTWDGWYLKGICHTLLGIFVLSVFSLPKFYPLGMAYAVASIALAAAAHKERHDNTFWAYWKRMRESRDGRKTG